MKVDFDAFSGFARFRSSAASPLGFVEGETDRLTDVLLCPPHHLSPVACCAVTRTHLQNGFETCTSAAREQHAALVSLLEKHDVRCHMLEPFPMLPDMCFTRDVGVATPFGLVALNPALRHRRCEVDALVAAYEQWDAPVRKITRGTIEGGDVCVAREGLLLVGRSGERSSLAGIEEFAAPFRAAGWQVLICPFHADHLHLDTIFCMLSEDEAIGCIDLLDPEFVNAVTDRASDCCRHRHPPRRASPATFFRSGSDGSSRATATPASMSC